MRNVILTGLAIAFAASLGGAVQAQTPEGAIALRKAGMGLMAAASGSVKRAIDAKGDVKPLKSTADAMGAWAGAYPGLFIAGSDKGTTKATAEAFSDAPGLAKAANNLQVAAQKLSVAADANDAAAFATAYAEVGAACGGCHRTYRQR
jgi:cytochrome c556